MKSKNEQTHIRLALRGKLLDWRNVSATLGCEPTAHFSRGDEFVNASGAHTREFGIWALDTTDFVQSDDLSDHIRELVARIKPAAIEEFIRDPAVSVQLYLWWVGDEGTMGFGISSDLLRKLCDISNEINASFVRVDR
jgi:hypothetical protein